MLDETRNTYKILVAKLGVDGMIILKLTGCSWPIN
jgi:hypothetical protein